MASIETLKSAAFLEKTNAIMGINVENKVVISSPIVGITTNREVLTQSGSRYRIDSIQTSKEADFKKVIQALPIFDYARPHIPSKHEKGYIEEPVVCLGGLIGKLKLHDGSETSIMTSPLCGITDQGQVITKTGSVYAFDPAKLKKEDWKFIRTLPIQTGKHKTQQNSGIDLE